MPPPSSPAAARTRQGACEQGRAGAAAADGTGVCTRTAMRLPSSPAAAQEFSTHAAHCGAPGLCRAFHTDQRMLSVRMQLCSSRHSPYSARSVPGMRSVSISSASSSSLSSFASCSASACCSSSSSCRQKATAFQSVMLSAPAVHAEQACFASACSSSATCCCRRRSSSSGRRSRSSSTRPAVCNRAGTLTGSTSSNM